MTTSFFFLLVFYLVAYVFGVLIEKIRIPRIYAALFLGVLLSTYAPVLSWIGSSPMQLLSDLGMFALLFLLGYGLEINRLREQKGLIFGVTFAVILSESLVGALILHFFFDVAWMLAGLIAVSFATVGEVALLPILKEFKIVETKLGQTILGVAVVDDIFEILSFILLLTLFGSLQSSEIVSEVIPLIAITLGVLAKNFLPTSQRINHAIDVLALWVFGPIFFFFAGTEANLTLLVDNFIVILLFTLAIKATKVTSAYLASRHKLGTKKAIVLGVSLSIKFSTSIIILIILLNKGLITEELFSILIGIKVLFKFIVPVVLSFLLRHWELHLKDAETTSNTVLA